MSQFDPATFLDAQINEANEKRPVLPVSNPEDPSGLYTAVIGEITTANGIIGKGDRAGQPWISMVIPLQIQICSELQAQGLPARLTLTDRAFLDLTPNGTLDNAKGKNRAQRLYRTATNQNTAGQPWSWRMLSGKVIKVKVAHEIYDGAIVEKIADIFPS